MQIYSEKKVIELNGQAPLLETMTSLLSIPTIMKIFDHIPSGFRSSLVKRRILLDAGEIGSTQVFHLTITLDSLAGSEKTDAGMSSMGKTGGKDERSNS